MPGGRREELERFLQANYRSLRAFARTLTPTMDDAEDLLHDALEKVVKKWGSITTSPLAYTYVTIRRTGVSNARKVRVRPQAADRPVPDQAAPGGPETTVLFAEGVRSLSEEELVVFALYAFSHKTQAQIADMTYMSSARVRGLLRSAEAKLEGQ